MNPKQAVLTIAATASVLSASAGALFAATGATEPPAAMPDLRQGENQVTMKVGAISRLPRIGARVRLTAPMVASQRVVGNVTEIDETSMTVLEEGSILLKVPFAAVTTLEVSNGRVRQWKKGALIGAGVGALLSIGFHKPNNQVSPSFGPSGCSYAGFYCIDDPGGARVAVTLGGALDGAALGALRKTDRWASIPVDQLRGGYVTGSGGAAPQPTPAQALPAPPGSSVAPASQGVSRAADTRQIERWMGTRFRIVLGSGEKLMGQMASLSPTEARIVTSAGPEVIERATIARLEVSTEPKSQWMKGALIGGAAGAALDFVDAPYCTTGERISGAPRSCSRAASASETAIGGAIIGGVIGHFTKKDIWRPFHEDVAAASEDGPAAPVNEPTLQVAPLLSTHDRKAGLAVRLSW